MSPFSSRSLNTVSITRLNNVGVSGSPYFTSLSTLNYPVYALFTLTFAVVFLRVSLVLLISEVPYSELVNLVCKI